jgi:quinol monooxygenase YgiN
MAIWTVDTWQVKPGRTTHFLEHCGPLSPAGLVLFRDLEKQDLFWSPQKWENREALEAWRNGSVFRSAAAQVKEDVSEQFTHLMEDVPGFAPRR